MPSAIVKTLYFDLDKLAWTLTAGGNALLQPLTIGQNDTIDFNVQFIKGGVAQTLTAPAWSAGIKILNGFSNAFVVQFGAPTGTPPTYTFTGTISSTELSAALLTGVQFALEFRDSTNGIVTLPALTLNIAASYTITGTTPTSANGTLNVAAGKTVTFPLTLTFPSAAGTNGQQLTLSNSTTGLLEWAASGISGLTVGTTTITSGTTTRVLYDNAGVVGEYAISGTGSVAMTGSPSFTGTLNAEAATFTGAVATTSNSGTIATNGATATIVTNGENADIYTSGNNADIYTSGTDALIYTQGINSYILSSGTFKLKNVGNFTTTLSHAATADRAIAFPDAAGTVALTSDITGGTLAGSFTTLAGTSSATLGTNGGTGGSVVLRGSTSGSATISTSATGVLALPSGTTAASMSLTTPALGVATATSVQVGNGTSSVTSLQIGNNALNGFYSPSTVGTDIGVSANGTWVAFWNSSWGLVARLPIIPLSNNGTSCGTSGLRWSGVYSVLGDFSGAVVCGTTLAVTGATTLTGLLTANGGITVVGGSSLLTTNTSLTNYNGSNTATLGSSSNAPNDVIGEPTKWIAIDDNGTTRYIPTWSSP